MKILYGIEEKFWFFFAGLIVMYWSLIGHKLETIYLVGDTFSAVFNAVGFGILYISIFISIIPSIVAGLVAIVLIKCKVSAINALIALSPLLAYYYWPDGQKIQNASSIQLALIHPLVVYITLRAVAPRFNVRTSVLGANCRPFFYPVLLFGIVLCAPITLAALYGKSYEGIEFSWSYMVFGFVTLVFLATKKLGNRKMEIFSAIVLCLVLYAMYQLAPEVLEVMAVSGS